MTSSKPKKTSRVRKTTKNAKKSNKLRYYKSLIKLIIKIQKIKLKKVYYF